jgi:hypothetical protein
MIHGDPSHARVSDLLVRLRARGGADDGIKLRAQLAQCARGVAATSLDCPLGAMVLELHEALGHRDRSPALLDTTIRRFLDGAAHRVCDGLYLDAIAACEADDSGRPCPLERRRTGGGRV